MQTNNTGFTLIELFVVVLIIGILSAVALPQYQKAVEKSKATQALVLLKSLMNAQTGYFLANGQYATKLDLLDIDMPGWTGNTKWSNYGHISDTRSNDNWSIQFDAIPSSCYIYLGRISGPYAGGGFIVDMNSPTPAILCVERFNKSGKIYSQTPDTYCKNIFGAAPVDLGYTTVRAYQMP